MGKWRNVNMKEWENEGMSRWRNGRMKECQDEGIGEWSNVKMKERENEGMSRWMNGRMARMKVWDSKGMGEWRNGRSKELKCNEKNRGKPKMENLWIFVSISRISLKDKRYVTFIQPHQRNKLNFYFPIFCLTVCEGMEEWRNTRRKEWDGRMKEWEKERFGYSKKAMG